MHQLLVIREILIHIIAYVCLLGLGLSGVACWSEGRLQQRGMFSKVKEYEVSTEVFGDVPV
ncbi:MAG: hypothetical protein BVN29_12490 [Nitrospira sp. ST-bin5]|nr:MAG: hypothetical protein BVN29_12490 [Nitrospira sp. ST-bin5]